MNSLARDTKIVNRPARLVDALAESRLSAARDAARYHGYDNAEGLDPFAEQTAWSAERGYYRIDAPVAVTIGGEPGEMTMTSYAAAPPSCLGKMIVALLREWQPGTSAMGIVQVDAGGNTIRAARRANAWYMISQMTHRFRMAGDYVTSDECRSALGVLVDRGVAESITVREAYGQTHARLAYRLSPRVSVSDLDALIGGA